MSDGVAWKIVSRAAGGDAAARHELVTATLDNLWTLAMRMTRQADEADEIVQETYSRAFAALPELEPIGKFEGYLARVATNLVIERWRRRRPTADLDGDVLTSETMEPWQSVAAEEDQQRRLAAIWAAVGDLAPEPRAALLLYHAQGEPYESIAGILQVPIGTVKTWLHRARSQVRRDAERILGAGSEAVRLQQGNMP
jgi:RNA polymerase sigma-70 factor, ECF subfamily